MSKRRGLRRAVARFTPLFLGLVLASSFATAAPAPTRGAAMRNATFSGSGRATMQVITLPVRVGRVAAVPGSTEVWAVGHSSSRRYSTAGAAGQIVFLRRVGAGDWTLAGPPRTAANAVFNPTLFGFAFARGGEGWAVGGDGVMLRRAPGSTEWKGVAPVTTSQLNGVSLVSGGGFAVGENATILRLEGGTWRVETPGTDLTTDGSPDLVAVSAVSPDEAWAVSGSSSENLLLYHRTGGAWRRVRTNQRIFDGPQRPADGPNGGTVDGAFGAAIAATRDTVWVGGQIFPADTAHPFGDETPGAASRPFVLKMSSDGASVVSYCPDQYGIRATARAANEEILLDRTMLCDQPFPLAAFDVTSLAVFGRNEVFAGGLGLFHFRDGGWFREPDAQGYVISLGMISPTEGWVATTGNTFGGGGAVHSSEATLGHWTTSPAPSRVARWPQPQMLPLEGVAIAPDASGRAVAVGGEGAVVSYLPGAGWDSINRVVAETLHAVAWSSPEEAWSVGEGGALARFDREKWFRHPLSGGLTRGSSLFGVAFGGSGQGYAVGARGTILRFDGRDWALDAASGTVTRETLYAIAATRTGFVAVGAKGTVIERGAAGWRPVGGIAGLIGRAGQPSPSLYAVATLDDGSVWAGGASSALIVRRPGRAFEASPDPLEGTVHALAGAGSALFASVSPDMAKYRGDRLYTTRGVLMSHEAGGWRDLSLDRRRSIYTGFDSSAYLDPMFALAVSRDGQRGWGVGGSPASQPDSEGHLRAEPTSSVYRFDLTEDPTPPGIVGEIDLPKDGFSFAMFSETWCGRGVCSSTLGSGTQADLVALQIQKEIEKAARLPNGPRFAMIAGNGRALGLPDELQQFKGYLGDFSIPVYGALGDKELFAGFEETTPGAALARANQRTSASNEYWKSVFADRPAPWGETAAPPGFREVEAGAEPRAGLARTHYAFDYETNGVKRLRVVVIDSSTKSYGRQTDQNPEESQGDWLEQVLIDAKGVVGGQAVPAIVVMNQPTVLPDRTQVPNWLTDGTTFEQTVARNAVSAVLTGGMRMNTSGVYTGTSSVPLYILGGGGGPLGFEPPTPTLVPTKLPSDGFYNAWHLVHVGASTPTAAGLPQAKITVKAFPIIESLAMHAIDGRTANGGQTLRFSALARSLPGGWADPDQSKATYFWLGNAAPPICADPGQGNGGCSSRAAIRPPYRFYSENPDIADFVRSDVSLGPQDPLVVDGKPVRDPDGREGLLCTYKAGTANINVVSGFHRTRMAVEVGGGFGRCVKEPVIAPPVEPVPEPRVEPPTVEVAGRPQTFFQPRGSDSAAVVFPPPPAPVVAPAPPGAPGVGRKEEHEASHETEGHGSQQHNKYGFTAVERSRRGDPAASWPYLGSLALLGFMAASVTAAARRKVVEPRPSLQRGSGGP